MALLNQPYEVPTENISLKILIYGQPGIGKSTIALSMPKPVLIDCDNGVHRIQADHRTPYLHVDSYSKVQQLLKSGELAPFETIVFDTAGKLLDYMGPEIIKKDPKNGKRSGGLSQQGYGVRKTWFSELLKQVTIMGKHVMFVAHEKEEKRGDDLVLRPEIGGSSGGDLMKELDLVGYMEAQGKKRIISFFPTDRFYAKNSARIDDVVVLPGLTKGVPNDYMTKIVNQVKATIAEEAEGMAKYNEMMAMLTKQIESVVDVKTASKALKTLTEADHKWDSRKKSSLLLLAKTKELGLEYSKDEGCFIDLNIPVADASKEPELVLSGGGNEEVKMPGIED